MEEEHSETYDAFEALCEAIFPEGENGLMFYWKACLDGSGKHSDLLVVAGYLGNRDHWKAFNRAWRPLLMTNGKFAPFHAADFESGNRDFATDKGWPKERRDEVRPRLIDALLGAQLPIGIACCVKIADYETNTERWKRETTGLDTAYEFAVSACIGTVARWSQLNRQSDPVHYIVEFGEGQEGKLVDAFNRSFAHKASREFFRLGSLTFQDKDGATGLQAADMLANYMWNWKIGNRVEIDPYKRITHAPNVVSDYFDKERIEREMAQDKIGRSVQVPEGEVNWKVPDPVDIVVTADFSEAEKVVDELELLARVDPQGVDALIKHTPSFEKLFSVGAENVSAGLANELRVSLKPNERAFSALAALRANNANSDLGELAPVHRSVSPHDNEAS